MFQHCLESDTSALSFTTWYELTRYNSSEAKSWKGKELYPMLIKFHHSRDCNTINQMCHSEMLWHLRLISYTIMHENAFFPGSKMFCDHSILSILSVCLCTAQYVCDYGAAHLRLGICVFSIEAYQLPYRNTHTMITQAPAPSPIHLINTLHLSEYTEPTKTQRSAVSYW